MAKYQFMGHVMKNLYVKRKQNVCMSVGGPLKITTPPMNQPKDRTWWINHARYIKYEYILIFIEFSDEIIFMMDGQI